MKPALTIRPSFWRRRHHLDRMSLRELVSAYFTYPAIIAYLALAAAAIGFFAARPAPLAPTLIAVAVATLIYPFVWYILHRWVLHSKWMWKSRLLSPTWKRIHYDHHQDPNHLEVLFGALHTTLPTIAIATLPIGYAIGLPWGQDAAWGAAAAAFATGLVTRFTVVHASRTATSTRASGGNEDATWPTFHDETAITGSTASWERCSGRSTRARRTAVKSPTGLIEAIRPRWGGFPVAKCRGVHGASAGALKVARHR